MLAGRRENVTVAGPEAYTSCRAIVLAGDSNMRNILSVLAKAFENNGHTRLFKYPTKEQEKLPCNKDFPNETCTATWADQTWMYGPAEGGRCTVVLLFRMLHNQGALERVATAPDASRSAAADDAWRISTAQCTRRTIGAIPHKRLPCG